jgi:hypothetical protein
VTDEDKLTPLGKAIRQRDAAARSGWERDYAGAIAEARASENPYPKDMSQWRAWNRNKAFRLIELLRAHRPLTDLTGNDLDALADLFEAAMTTRRPGAERDEAVHDAARLAETLMMAIRRYEGGKVPDSARTWAIEEACKQLVREGRPVQAQAVRDLLSRPKSRRRSP